MSDTDISIVGHCGTSRSSIPDERMTLVRYNERNKSISHGHCLCNRTQFVSKVDVRLCTCSQCTLLRTRRRHLLLSLRYCRPYTNNLRGEGGKKIKTIIIIIQTDNTDNHTTHGMILFQLTRFTFRRDVTGIAMGRRAFAFIRSYGVHACSRRMTRMVISRAFVDI